MVTAREPVGVLIVRAWVEGDREEGLRAVITRTLDVAGTEETVSHAGTVPDVLAVAEAWLEALVAARLGPGPDAPGESEP